MKGYLTRGLLTIAALASPLVLALSIGAASAGAAVIRGRSGRRIAEASTGLPGAALGVIVAAIVVVVAAALYFGIRSSLRATAASQAVRLRVVHDSEVDETRKAA